MDGSVTIATPDANLIQSGTELTSNIIEPGNNIVQACAASKKELGENELTITGRGGIPHEPGFPLDSQIISINGDTTSTSAIPKPIETSEGEIQPARGIKVTKDGGIVLTAYRTNNSGTRILDNSPNCG